MSRAELGGESDFSVRGEGDDAGPFDRRPPLRAEAGVPLPWPNCAASADSDLGVFALMDGDFFALDGSGNSSLISNLRGSSRGTKRPLSPPGAVALAPGVPWSVDDAKNSAGLLLILVAEAETLGRILPPP